MVIFNWEVLIDWNVFIPLISWLLLIWTELVLTSLTNVSNLLIAFEIEVSFFKNVLFEKFINWPLVFKPTAFSIASISVSNTLWAAL